MALTLGGNPMSSIRVLIVDNDPKIVELLKTILQHFGFSKLSTAQDGKSALAMMHAKAYDLVLSDWQMQGMDGLDFIHYLRNSPHSPDCFVPVIMITGKAERQDIEAARDSGVTEFLAKPFTVEDLRTRIINVFESPRDFVFSQKYTGPSRRRRKQGFDGDDKRSED